MTNERAKQGLREAVCPDCNGRGVIETGEMENGPGGIGYETLDCVTCGENP